MVNSNKLTVSKLSRLQKQILLQIQESNGDIIIAGLAELVAADYNGTRRQRLNKVNPEDFLKDERYTGKQQFILYETYRALQKHPYKNMGTKGEYICSNIFKASFYRSIKRLIKRGLLERYIDYYTDEFTKQIKHFDCIKLTETGKIYLSKEVPP